MRFVDPRDVGVERLERVLKGRDLDNKHTKLGGEEKAATS